MTYHVIADPLKCGHGCTEPCVKAWPTWETLGKGLAVDNDNPEMADMWAGCLLVKDACERGAILFKVIK